MGNWIGLVVAGVLNGSFAVPLKKTQVWKFHHVWGVFSILAMVFLPWLGILAAVPSWRQTLAAIPNSQLASLFALGLVWGAASLLYGLAVDYLGVALGISIQLGLSIIVGSLVPLLTAQALRVESLRDIAFFGGLVLMVLGVVVCARAGGSRPGQIAAARSRFRTGLIIAVLAGVGGPLLNVGIQYGIDVLRGVGRSAPQEQWVAWAILLSAAAVTQSGYCLLRVAGARNANLFWAGRAHADAGLVLVMSLIWAASIYFYASSVAALGRLGTSFGWPIFISLIVVTSNVWGVLLGEWRERPRAALIQMLTGSAILVASAFLIAQTRPM
jgi:L-rhamnose-H+ transport protein